MAKMPLRKPVYADPLTESVARGDMLAVRAHFDRVLWGDSEQRPTWEQLKLAVINEDVPMARLLVTWGARASAEDLAKLQKEDPKQYPAYLNTLRRSGHGISPKALRESVAAAENLPPEAQNESLRPYHGQRFVDDTPIDARAQNVPREWRQVLDSFQKQGAPEAVIAGGALRDLFNKRAIKDVDIFMQTRGSERKNRKFLAKVFEAANIPVQRQMVSMGYSHVAEAFPGPNKGTLVSRISNGYGVIRAASHTEAWTVIAGPDKTEYNIVFVDGPLGNAIKRAATENSDGGKRKSAALMIGHFDLGLCQIAFDGTHLHTTDAYRRDVLEKRITLIKENGASAQHLTRIMEKYNDHQICDDAKALLKKDKKEKIQKKRYSYGYGSFY